MSKNQDAAHFKPRGTAARQAPGKSRPAEVGTTGAQTVLDLTDSMIVDRSARRDARRSLVRKVDTGAVTALAAEGPAGDETRAVVRGDETPVTFGDEETRAPFKDHEAPGTFADAETRMPSGDEVTQVPAESTSHVAPATRRTAASNQPPTTSPDYRAQLRTPMVTPAVSRVTSASTDVEFAGRTWRPF